MDNSSHVPSAGEVALQASHNDLDQPIPATRKSRRRRHSMDALNTWSKTEKLESDMGTSVSEKSKLEMLQCDKCSFKKRTVREELIEHEEKFHYSFFCCYCESMFRYEHDLHMHRRIMHTDQLFKYYKGKFPCDQCNLTFLTLPSWRHHRMTHESCHLSCNTCQVKVHDHQGHKLQKYQAHKMLHDLIAWNPVDLSMNAVYKCDYCLKSFRTIPSMFKHRLEHVAKGDVTKMLYCTKCEFLSERKHSIFLFRAYIVGS